ncbi:MAG: ral secretion pathway protein [Rhodospirillales bacterium]|nr:ral secretion pathway protein [Rhodospirillales bacterium]
MITAMSAWKGRIAALLILIGVVAAAYLLLIGPLLADYDETRLAVADARDRLAQLDRLRGVEAELEQQMAKLRQRQSSTSLYLTKGSDALAAVEIQDRVKSFVEQNGGAVRSVQAMPGQGDGGFRRVTVRLQMTVTTTLLYRMLYRLEAEAPALFVDNIAIQSTSSREGDGKAADPPLTVSFDVFGYLPGEAQ